MDSGGKKRISDRQLTKDNYDEGEEGWGENCGGTFQRADDSVLAQRRIVKARRPPTSGGAGAGAGAVAKGVGGVSGPAGGVPAGRPGLFAGFSLINQAPRSPGPATVGDSDAGGGGEIPRDEADLDPRGRPVPPMPDPEVEEGPPKAAEADVHSDPDTDDDEITSQPRKVAPQASDDGKAEKAETDGEEQREGKAEGPVETAGRKEEEDAKEAKADAGSKPFRFSALGSDGFAKLSAAPNAFSSAFGVPFSGSATASPFPSLSAPAPSPVQGASGTSAFPSLSSVFGTTNGAKLQLFGSPTTAAEGGTSGGLAAAPSSTPAITLPAVDVVTGEEEERALFAADASLFEFVEGGKWKERGKGEVRLNAPESDSRPARLVMRARGNLRLLLNANLFSEMKVTRMDGRGLSFACINSVEDAAESSSKAAVTTLALRFKEEALASELFDLINTHKHHKPVSADDSSKHENGKETDVTHPAASEEAHGGKVTELEEPAEDKPRES